MSITSDQPISAGNLKAALDGLTGGSLLSYKVLLVNNNDTDGEKTYQLADNVKNYNFLIVAYGGLSIHDGELNAAYSTEVIYTANNSKPFRYHEGNSPSNDFDIKIEGDKWIGSGYRPYPPRLVVGFNLKL